MNKLKNTKKSAAFDRSSLIINLFREFPNNKFSLKHLASASGGATKEGRLRTREIITELLAQGTIEECGQEKYRLSGKERPRQEGIVQMISTGAMYIRSEEFENDVYVSQRNSLNALDGDRVEFVITRRSHAGSLEGEITRIVERSRKQYVGTADVSDHAIFVKMDPRRMPMDVYLSKRDNPNVQHGDKVVIRITDWALGSKKPRRRAGRGIGPRRREQYRDARHPGRIRPALPFRAKGRRCGPGHSFDDHQSRLCRPARLPQDNDLHHRPGGRQGLRRRPLDPQDRRRRVGRWAYISPT